MRTLTAKQEAGVEDGRVFFVRLGTLAWFVLGTVGAVGQGASLPPTAPTAVAGAPSLPGVSLGSAALPERTGPVRHRASVIVDHERLEIRAQNSSLNAILREVAAQTGMTITGGVLDQRVFGTYGPAPAAEVLSELLQDTGTNMILQMSSNGGPGELTLTPRMGGPTPPAPSTFREEEYPAGAAAVPQATLPIPVPSQVSPLPISGRAAQPPGMDSVQAPVTPDSSGIAGPPMAAPANTPGPATQTTGATGSTGSTDQNSGSTNAPGAVNPQSPNGVRTPQQIYDELQRLQQQQQKQPGNP